MIALTHDRGEDIEPSDLARRLAAATAQLRGLTLGLRPAGLEELGLEYALRQLVAHVPLDIGLTVSGHRFAKEVEATAWFVPERIASSLSHS